jgi:hypothetical protein
MKGFSYNIKILSEAHGRNVNVTALCKRLKISRAHYYDIIQGRKGGSPGVVGGICQELGLNPLDVMSFDISNPR